jgi:hypothetical protein
VKEWQFTEAQFVARLRKVEAGVTVPECAGDLKVSAATVFRWQSWCGRAGVGYPLATGCRARQPAAQANVRRPVPGPPGATGCAEQRRP